MSTVPIPKLRRIKGISPHRTNILKEKARKIYNDTPEDRNKGPHSEGTNEYLSQLGFGNQERNSLFEKYGKEPVKQAARIHHAYRIRNVDENPRGSFEYRKKSLYIYVLLCLV